MREDIAEYFNEAKLSVPKDMHPELLDTLQEAVNELRVEEGYSNLCEVLGTPVEFVEEYLATRGSMITETASQRRAKWIETTIDKTIEKTKQITKAIGKAYLPARLILLAILLVSTIWHVSTFYFAENDFVLVGLPNRNEEGTIQALEKYGLVSTCIDDDDNLYMVTGAYEQQLWTFKDGGSMKKLTGYAQENGSTPGIHHLMPQKKGVTVVGFSDDVLYLSSWNPEERKWKSPLPENHPLHEMPPIKPTFYSRGIFSNYDGDNPRLISVTGDTHYYPDEIEEWTIYDITIDGIREYQISREQILTAMGHPSISSLGLLYIKGVVTNNSIQLLFVAGLTTGPLLLDEEYNRIKWEIKNDDRYKDFHIDDILKYLVPFEIARVVITQDEVTTYHHFLWTADFLGGYPCEVPKWDRIRFHQYQDSILLTTANVHLSDNKATDKFYDFQVIDVTSGNGTTILSRESDLNFHLHASTDAGYLYPVQPSEVTQYLSLFIDDEELRLLVWHWDIWGVTSEYDSVELIKQNAANDPKFLDIPGKLPETRRYLPSDYSTAYFTSEVHSRAGLSDTIFLYVREATLLASHGILSDETVGIFSFKGNKTPLRVNRQVEWYQLVEFPLIALTILLALSFILKPLARLSKRRYTKFKEIRRHQTQ